MRRPLQLARDLLAQAASAPEEEARNAAVKAAKIIAKYGFVIEEPVASPEPVDYGPAWAVYFHHADPAGGAGLFPHVVFCHAVRWMVRDLDNIAKNRKKLSDAKLLRLLDFAIARQLPLPIDASHPAWHRMKALHVQRKARKRQMVLPHVPDLTNGIADAGQMLRTAAERAASRVTIKDVMDLFKA